MTEKITYTESALADRFSSFFKEFKNKETHNYSYVDSIDNLITTKHIFEIDYNDLTDELKEICKTIIQAKVHIAIYRAIGETFQSRFGGAELEIFKRNNFIRFTINNIEKFKGKIFEDPTLIYLDNDDDGKFAGDHKINNVAQQLQIENTFITLRESEEILMYTGKIYDEIQAKNRIKERTEQLIPDCTEHHRNEVVSKIKAQTFKEMDSFDDDPNTNIVENGILNLETMQLDEHSPDHLSRVLIPNEFIKPKFEINNDTIFEDIEKNLKDTLFWKFLTASFTVDGKFKKQEFETILEIIASPIIKHQIDDKAFMFLGSGDNGKTKLLDYIQLMMGERNGKNISLQDIADDQYMRADLDGMSFNIFPDLEKNELKHTGKVKAICSGERIQVRKIYGHPFGMQTFAKLIFSCNRFPKVFDQSQGFFRRWIIVKWERNFENDPERNEKLGVQLSENKDERNQVFSCMVYLARRLRQNGKFTHSKDWKIVQKEWNENADPIDEFETNCIIDSETHKSKRETYKFYKEYCFEKGETPLGMGQFSKIFSEYHDDDRLVRERIWLNIDFKRPKQTTMNNVDENNKL